MVAKLERQQEWQERVAQWRTSGLSQRAFALEHGFSQKQISYWSRRFSALPPLPGFVPVRVTPAVAPAAISLRSANGWTLTLPRDVSASWLAEMMRAL
jgi:hypothetical protein